MLFGTNTKAMAGTRDVSFYHEVANIRVDCMSSLQVRYTITTFSSLFPLTPWRMLGPFGVVKVTIHIVSDLTVFALFWRQPRSSPFLSEHFYQYLQYLISAHKPTLQSSCNHCISSLILILWIEPVQNHLIHLLPKMPSVSFRRIMRR